MRKILLFRLPIRLFEKSRKMRYGFAKQIRRFVFIRRVKFGIIFSIMLIFNIAGLRHSGQELEFLRLSKIAFALVIAAGVCRGFLAYVWSGFYIHLPATFIAVAFALWFTDFYKIFKDNEFSDDPE